MNNDSRRHILIETLPEAYDLRQNTFENLNARVGNVPAQVNRLAIGLMVGRAMKVNFLVGN